VFEEGVLEARREVDLGAAGGRELVEHLVRQGAGSVLNRTRQPIRAGDSRKLGQDVEVERDRGHAAVRQRSAAVARASLDGHLREPDRALRPRIQLAAVAVEVGLELVRCGVLLADLADLAADADGHAVGLERADEGGQLCRAHVVLVLLLVERGEDRSTSVELSMSMFR